MTLACLCWRAGGEFGGGGNRPGLSGVHSTDVSRILLLFLFLLWMAWPPDAQPVQPASVAADTGVFLGLYAALVLGLGAYSRLVARGVASAGFSKRLRRFNQAMLVARILVPAWFGVGVYVLGWAWTVRIGMGFDGMGPTKLPGLLIGTLPGILAWIGLWWAQFPAERTLREQNVLSQLEDGLPLHTPLGFWPYFWANLRLQVLFTLVPVLLIVAVRDGIALLVGDWSAQSINSRTGRNNSDLIEFITFIISAGLVFVFAPEILRRVLKTSPLPDGPLRRRLEAMCRRGGMKYRDILVWHTHFHLGNAAVMGIMPQMRYILLSDLLLERMDDEQIEAVFAHEVGHIVHRHMAWYLVFFLVLFLGSLGLERAAAPYVEQWEVPNSVLAPLSLVIMAGGFWIVFGYLSRRFERQADVYAARTMESGRRATLAVEAAATGAPIGAGQAGQGSHVGHYGATIFASALRRVALINNIPISPRSPTAGGPLQRIGYVLGSFMDLAHDWLHGSIPHRMAYLHGLSADPRLTLRFDRVMTRLYCTMLVALFTSALWLLMAR